MPVTATLKALAAERSNERCFELTEDLGISQTLSPRLRNYYDVVRGFAVGALGTKNFADETLDSVPYDRVADAGTDGHAEPPFAPRPPGTNDDEMSAVVPATLPLHPEKFLAATQTCRLGKRLIARHGLSPAAWTGSTR